MKTEQITTNIRVPALLTRSRFAPSPSVLLPLLQVESTNIGHFVTVRFNLASRSAYSGDWGWVLGGVDPSLTLEDANSLSAADANVFYDERCKYPPGGFKTYAS